MKGKNKKQHKQNNLNMDEDNDLCNNITILCTKLCSQATEIDFVLKCSEK